MGLGYFIIKVKEVHYENHTERNKGRHRGFVGHSGVHPEVLQKVQEIGLKEVEKGNLIDCQTLVCGDDIALVMTHQHGVDSELVHGIAWRAFEEGTAVSKN